MSGQIIVVGGGLSGLSAAHTVLERGGNVVVIDKNSFFGGNSTKATSGINGALTKTQIDSAEIFAQDTTRSARDLARPDLIKVLTGNSASAVEWLQEKFKLDLSLVSRLGGHSQPRTHRGKEMFPGMTITYALMEGIEEIAKKQPDRVRLIKKARATKLIKEGETVVGVEYVKDGQTFKEYGPVVLATGGYAADFTEDSLIKKYRPDIYHLPTTNGDHSTGDGHKMIMSIGGKATHMEKVQVHPTGLVDPKEPNAKIKFLAAEALRGVGGLLLNGEGKRFCDELGHRDYVTGEIWKTKGPIRLVLNSKASKEIEWHCKHYVGRGLMRKFSGEALAREIDSEVRNEQGNVIPGLYASGELAGGVHVYGRVAGDSASRYLFQNLSCATANRRLEQITGQLAPYQATVSVDPASQKVNLEISWGQQKDAISQYTPAQTSQASPSQAPAPEKKAEVPREKKEYTAEDVAKHNKENDHPGGKKAILIYAGKDATEE
ncbi:14908_t:CDS:2, partial [Racocetra fulgida]